MKVWQVLPMGPTGYGESPYQSTSVFAGSPMLISIEKNISFMARNEDYLMEESMKNLPSETMRMAIVMVVVIPIACSYPFFQRYFVGGLTIGAVKG